jgi:pyrimidine deaminase RibD-like protein
VLEDNGKPMVGAVVARDGNLLVATHRGEIPKNHAEYIALEIRLPTEILAGATVYTTLEPCTKRNQPKIPCAARLVQRKVRRVFIGMLDPNPDIQGHGVRVLRDANIEVQFFPPDLMPGGATAILTENLSDGMSAGPCNRGGSRCLNYRRKS